MPTTMSSWWAPASAGWKRCTAWRGALVRITVVDRRNHHLFQPLLYQVATASLATSEIGWPIRYLPRRGPEATTLLETVAGIDPGGADRSRA
jgi:NADH dehydrogenase